MKKIFRVASLALVGAMVAQAFVPMSAFAEEQIVELQVQEETIENIDSSEEVVSVEDTASEATNSEEAVSEETVSAETTSAETVSDDTASSETVTEVEVTVPAESKKTTEDDIKEDELAKELEKDETLELVDVDENQDFNNDGINDLYTKMLCDGEILTESGAKVFGDKSFATVQATDDLDGDNLLNGAEVTIQTREDGTLYAVLVSDPCKRDSDGDGIYDADDTAVWERGLAGGVLGSVRLIAHHDDAENFIDGHVYIVYTSYVNNLEISIDNLYGYYIANPEKKALLDSLCDDPERSKEVSWRSTVDELNEANYAAREKAADELYIPQKHDIYAKGTVKLNRGDYISIGNYTMLSQQEIIEADYLPFIKNDLSKLTLKEKLLIIDFARRVLNQSLDEEYYKDHIDDLVYAIGERAETFVDHAINGKTTGGVWINRELNHQKLGYDQGPNECVEQDATWDQLNVMLNHFANHSYYNIFTHNCVTASAGAWNAVYGYEKDENGKTVQSRYYVENGTKISGIAYSPKSRWFKNFDFTVSHPGAVKESVKTMKDLPGYVGHMTYVTGKKLVNTLNNAVKRFDITKLFRKKAVTETATSNTVSYSYNNETASSEVKSSVITDTKDLLDVSEDMSLVEENNSTSVEETVVADKNDDASGFEKVEAKKVAINATQNTLQKDSEYVDVTITEAGVPLAQIGTFAGMDWLYMSVIAVVTLTAIAVVALFKKRNS